MPDAARYALFRNPANAAERPVIFPTSGALARHIHRARAGAGIDLVNAQLVLEPGQKPTPGVKVLRLGLGGDPEATLGWVYIAGGDREVLRAALDAAEPQPVRRAA